MQEKLKQYRLDLDALAELTENLEQEEQSWELTSASIALRFAKAYIGKTLGSRGVETPYKNDGKRKEVSDIEPTDSTVNELNHRTGSFEFKDSWKESGLVEKVDWLREEIQKAITNTENLFDAIQPKSRHEAVYRTQVFVNLTDARLWLGFELERIRNEQTGNKSKDV